MTESYHWDRFTVYMYYKASREQVYRAWATADGLASFFIRRALHTSSADQTRRPEELVQAGDSYLWEWYHDYRLEGSYIESVTNKKILFTFGPMKVAVELTQKNGEVLLELQQYDIPTETDQDRAWMQMNCRCCWTYFLLNLKSVLEQGVDLREHDPAKSDCVGIGFLPV